MGQYKSRFRVTGMNNTNCYMLSERKNCGELDFWEFHHRESFQMNVRHEPVNVSSAVIVIFF